MYKSHALKIGIWNMFVMLERDLDIFTGDKLFLLWSIVNVYVVYSDIDDNIGVWVGVCYQADIPVAYLRNMSHRF